MSEENLPLPASYQYGFVTCRIIDSIADTSKDADNLPEAIPSKGQIIFTPKDALRKETGAATAFVKQASHKYNLHAETGQLVNSQMESAFSQLTEVSPGEFARLVPEAGVWLYAGNWTVKFSLESGTLSSFDITVTGSSTPQNPLDLVTVAPTLPSAGQVLTSILVPTPLVEGRVLGTVSGSLAWVEQTGGSGGVADWDTILNKPAVVSEGATTAEARASIGAGTSDLALGTTPSTAKAGDYAPPAASATTQGVVELATTAEATTGTDTTRAVTPQGLKGVADTKANATHTHGVSELDATGTRDSTTILYGDNTWKTAPTAGSGMIFGTTAGTATEGNDSRVVNSVPNSRTVNGQPLTGNVSLSAADVGAAPTLGVDDNYVTDVEKAALHGHTNKSALDSVTGVNTGDQTLPTWSTLAEKPATFPPTIGATGADAVAGNDSRLTNARTPTTHTHPISELDATGTRDSTTILYGDGTWKVADTGVTFGTTTGTATEGDDARVVNAVPNTRTVNGKPLTTNITLTAADVSAAPVLGSDDNYVTDVEKAALHTHTNQTALNAVTGVNTGDQTLPTWSTLTGKPVVVAEGATQAAARTAIGATDLVIGTTSTTAKAGNYAPAAASATAQGIVELATTTEATTGTDTVRAVTPAGLKAVADTKATSAQGALASTAVQPAGLTKAAVGLGNADNTSDVNKPVSTAQQVAFNATPWVVVHNGSSWPTRPTTSRMVWWIDPAGTFGDPTDRATGDILDRAIA